MQSIKAKPPSPISRLATLAFRKYAPDLHRYLLRRMRRKADVPDLIQEVFERFLRTSKADMIRNPQAFLFGIASHVISDANMKEDKSLVTYDSETLDQVTDNLDHALPDTLADELGIARELSFALSRLPESHRAVLLLIKRDGLSYEETAQRMNLTVATVTTYLFEARAKVKMTLKRRGER